MMVQQGGILGFTIVTDREWVTETPKTGSPIQSTSQTSDADIWCQIDICELATKPIRIFQSQASTSVWRDERRGCNLPTFKEI